MGFKDKDLTKAKPMANTKDQLPKIDEFYKILKLKKDHSTLRVLEGYTSYAMYWIPIVGAKTGKQVRIPKPCFNYDPETEEFTDDECPYAKLGVNPQVKYLFNVIDREEQEEFSGKSRANSKEKKSGFKSMDSKSKTPVVVLHGPPSIANKLQKLSDLNKGKKNKKKKYAVSDPKEGIDVLLAFDGDKKGGDMYDAQRDEKTPLTKEEMQYLIWDLDAYPEAMKEVMDIKAAKKDAKQLLKVLDKSEIDGEDESSEDSEMEDDSKKSKKKSKGKDKKSSKKKSKKDSSEESEDDGSEESELDVSESDDSEEDSSEGSEEDSENSEEDSEEEKPKKKSKAKSKKSSKKKSKKDDSEDDSEESEADSEDESEESEEDSSEGSEDDSSEEESEEEKPKKKSKSKKSSKSKNKKSSKKKKKSKKDDSEDDDDSESDDIPF